MKREIIELRAAIMLTDEQKEKLDREATELRFPVTGPSGNTTIVEKGDEMTVEDLYGDYDINDNYEDDEPLDCCPKCGRDYDEIGADFQYCKACGWDAENKKWDNPIEPTDDDFMAGEADLLTGKWY